jgi:hypothetical protein
LRREACFYTATNPDTTRWPTNIGHHGFFNNRLRLAYVEIGTNTTTDNYATCRRLSPESVRTSKYFPEYSARRTETCLARSESSSYTPTKYNTTARNAYVSSRPRGGKVACYTTTKDYTATRYSMMSSTKLACNAATKNNASRWRAYPGIDNLESIPLERIALEGVMAGHLSP